MADEQLDLSPSMTPPPTEADYDAIFAAVMETMRGRWFLAEYAQRNRTADTALVLAAIDRVQASLREARPAAASASPAERIRIDLVEMAKAIARTRAEIASIKPDGDHKGSLSEATEELDSIVHTTERATSDILAAAEQVQEIAWTLREHGTDCEACDALDRRAADIYTACSFQDLTGQRTRKVVDVLRFLEQRIKAMIDIWGDTVEPSDARLDGTAAPQIYDAPGAQHLDQPHIDEMMPGTATPQMAESGSSDGDDADAAVAAPAEETAPGPQASARGEPEAPAPDTPAPHAPAPAGAPPVADTAPAPSGSAPAAAAESPPAPAIVPAVAVVGATVLELSPPDIVAAVAPAPAGEPEAAPAPGAPAAADPAAVLERILAIIHEPIEDSAGDIAGKPVPASESKPVAPLPDPVMPPAPSLDAAREPSRPARAPAPPASIEDIPFAGYAGAGQMSVADAIDEMLMDVPVRVDLPAPAPPAAGPLAMSAPAGMPETPPMPEPVAAAAPEADRAAPDRAAPRTVEPAPPGPEPASTPEPALAAPAAEAPAPSEISPLRPEPPSEEQTGPPPPAPDRIAARPVGAFATAPLAEPPPVPRVAAATQKPAPPARHDGLAAFTALSDEEKIALFS